MVATQWYVYRDHVSHAIVEIKELFKRIWRRTSGVKEGMVQLVGLH